VLPIPDAAFRAAIERKGVAVKSNLSGFELGLALVRTRTLGARRARPRRAEPDASDGASSRASLPADLRPLVETLPLPVRALADARRDEADRLPGRGLRRRYLELLRPSCRSLRRRGPDGDGRAVARYLALWMSYEDAVRVADLKTRAARFARIRASARAATVRSS
jgi:indolepyruvate ferredoxin oxidoreductase beta subunit